MIRGPVSTPYKVFFTTRQGGVSDGSYSSLNLGLLTEDDPARVQENRRRACAEAGMDFERLAMNRQVHGAVLNRGTPGMRSAEGDGLWTDEPDVPLLVLGADCLPIVLVREGRPGVSVLHAGRSGLLSSLIEEAVAALGASRLAAVLGPAIGVCCYEVREDVAGPYRARFGQSVLSNGHLDLRAAAERLLRDAGVERIDHVDRCTACDPELFFSHRRDGPRTGRQGVLACIA